MVEIEVQLVSAAWCKRCQVVLPDIIATCSMTGAIFTYVDYDELDDGDPLKSSIKSLPTIRLSTNGGISWISMTANDDWKTVIIAAAPITFSDAE